MLLDDKRGDEKLMSAWMFVAWVIIGGGIIFGIMLFYSAETDIRELQADYLKNRIVSCIVEDEFLNSDLIKGDFDFFEECNFNKKMFDENKFYFKVEVLDVESGESLLEKPVVAGNPDFETQCEIRDETEAEARYFARCSGPDLFVLYSVEDENKQILVSIVTGSNNLGEII